MIVVFVVMVDDETFSTLEDSLVLVLVTSNTFFGARSNGRKSVSVPASASFSTKDPSWPSTFSLLESDDLLLVREVKLEIDALLWTE